MLYRQGVGDIIQTLCHIHKSSQFYENVYLFFDNSFIPPIKISRNPNKPLLQRRIKQFIYWNEYFFNNAKPLNIIYESHILNTRDKMHLLTSNDELYDISLMERAVFDHVACDFTFQQSSLDIISKADILKFKYGADNINFVKSKIQHNPDLKKDEIGLILRTAPDAASHQRLNENECENIVNFLTLKNLKYNFVPFVKEEGVEKADNTSFNSMNFSTNKNNKLTKEDLINHNSWLHDLSKYKFLICTEGGHCHIAACMNIPVYLVGNFDEHDELNMRNYKFWEKYYEHSKVTVLNNYMKELFELL